MLCLLCFLKEYSIDELPTPTKPPRSSSKVSSTSSQPSPTRATVADSVVNGTRSPPLSKGLVETSPAPPPRKRPRRGIMSVDLPPVTNNVDDVTPMEVTPKDDKGTTTNDGTLCVCVCVCVNLNCRVINALIL